MLDTIILSAAKIAPLLDGVVIPTNPFDMEKLTPYFNDLVGKITLGGTIGLAGFLMVTGVYVVINFIKGLFK